MYIWLCYAKQVSKCRLFRLKTATFCASAPHANEVNLPLLFCYNCMVLFPNLLHIEVLLKSATSHHIKSITVDSSLRQTVTNKMCNGAIYIYLIGSRRHVAILHSIGSAWHGMVCSVNCTRCTIYKSQLNKQQWCLKVTHWHQRTKKLKMLNMKR